MVGIVTATMTAVVVILPAATITEVAPATTMITNDVAMAAVVADVTETTAMLDATSIATKVADVMMLTTAEAPLEVPLPLATVATMRVAVVAVVAVMVMVHLVSVAEAVATMNAKTAATAALLQLVMMHPAKRTAEVEDETTLERSATVQDEPSRLLRLAVIWTPSSCVGAKSMISVQTATNLSFVVSGRLRDMQRKVVSSFWQSRMSGALRHTQPRRGT